MAESLQYNPEISKPTKWVMEISHNKIGVEHPSDYDLEKLSTEEISIDELVGFEPDEKMQKPESLKKVLELAEKIKNGTYNAPAILVRKYEIKYQIVDGHHRFHAHKLAGKKVIEAKVIPDEDIEYRDGRRDAI